MCTALWLYQTNADPAAGVLVAWDKSLTKKPKISAQCSESQCKVVGTQPHVICSLSGPLVLFIAVQFYP